MKKERGETQTTFAARLGVPKSTYVAWERGEAEPAFSLLQKILVAFGQRAAFTAAGFALDQREACKIGNSSPRNQTRMSFGEVGNLSVALTGQSLIIYIMLNIAEVKEGRFSI